VSGLDGDFVKIHEVAEAVFDNDPSDLEISKDPKYSFRNNKILEIQYRTEKETIFLGDHSRYTYPDNKTWSHNASLNYRGLPFTVDGYKARRGVLRKGMGEEYQVIRLDISRDRDDYELVILVLDEIGENSNK